MPEQPTLSADERSAFPHRAGVPWWAAVLIAVVATLAGFAIEAGLGHQELGFVFAGCYALGCIAAVLLVRQSGIFTTVIQPPLLLFVAVPLAYFLLHGSAFTGLKDVAISCGYPLVERFPLMLFTSATVLLIGLVRWYGAISAPAGSQPATAGRPEAPSLFAGLAARVSSAFAGNGTQASEEAGAPGARPRHGINRRRAAEDSRRTRPTRERTPARSRRERPEADASPRPRRDSTHRPREDDGAMDPPRRRSREPRRTPPSSPREARQRREARAYRDPGGYRDSGGYRDPGGWDSEYRDGGGHRDDYPPRPARASRFDPYEPDYPRRGHRPQPEYDPYPVREPRRGPARGAETTHHPVSRVRYRRSGPDRDPSDGPPVR